jgi:hypothetical protein
MVWLVRHRQTKGPETDRPNLNHRATSLLYNRHFARKVKSSATPFGAAQRLPLLNQAGPTQKALRDAGRFIEPELV